MDASQFQGVVLASTVPDEVVQGMLTTRKYTEESFADRVVETATIKEGRDAGNLRLDVAATMVNDLLRELAHAWTQGFDFFRMFFGYLLPQANHIGRVSLLHQLNQSLNQQAALRAYAAQRGWVKHLCELVPVLYDIVLLGEVSQLMKTIGAFSISQIEMKWLLRLLDSYNKQRPPWWPLIVEVLQHIFEPRAGPDAFFSFFTKEGGFMVPMHEREVLHNHGYTFTAWIKIEALPKHHQPCLYSFLSDGGEGFECLFTGNSLTFRTRVSKKKTVTQKMSYQFQLNQWYFICISHSYRYLFSSELSLYVNGSLTETTPLLYPKTDSSTPLTRCHVGNSHTLNQGFFGQMGTVTFFAQALPPVEIHALYGMGPNQQPITNSATTDITVGLDGNEFTFDTRHTPKVVFCYNPKADEGLLVQDVASSNI